MSKASQEIPDYFNLFYLLSIIMNKCTLAKNITESRKISDQQKYTNRRAQNNVKKIKYNIINM